MLRPWRTRIAMVLALCSLSIGLAGWLLRPRVEAIPRRTVDLPALEQRLRQVRSAPLVQPAPDEPAVPATAPPLHPHPLSEGWAGLREEVDLALFRRVPLPREGATRREAGAYRQRVRERRRYLAVLELELVDTIENEPQPYTRLDAEVRLAEVYLAQAEALDQTWVPDNWSDARARRRLDRLEEQAAVARDKAELVKTIAQAEASGLRGLADDDPLHYRLTDLLRTGSPHGG